MKKLLLILIVFNLYITVNAQNYNYENQIKLTRYPLINSYWLSEKIISSGYLEYNISSLNERSLISILIIDIYEINKYKQGDNYKYYKNASNYMVPEGKVVSILIEFDFYIIIENESTFDGNRVNVSISYKYLEATIIDNMNLYTIIIIAMIIFILLTIISISFFISIYYKRRRMDYIMLHDNTNT